MYFIYKVCLFWGIYMEKNWLERGLQVPGSDFSPRNQPKQILCELRKVIYSRRLASILRNNAMGKIRRKKTI